LIIFGFQTDVSKKLVYFYIMTISKLSQFFYSAMNKKSKKSSFIKQNLLNIVSEMVDKINPNLIASLKTFSFINKFSTTSLF